MVVPVPPTGFIKPAFTLQSLGLPIQIGPAPSSKFTHRVFQPKPGSGFDDIEATVTIEEVHNDELVVTEHPVEIGSPISDHAYKRPAEVQLRVAWNNNTLGLFGLGLSAAGVWNNDPDHIQHVYDYLRELMDTFQLLTIHTGKRVYENMVIQRINVTTDKTSENSLMVTMNCREVFIAKTTTTALNSDPNFHKVPESTLPPKSNGTIKVNFTGTSTGVPLPPVSP
jgi:hypothetical protein